MPRTIQLNLSQVQFDDLVTLISHGEDQLDRMMEDEIDDEVLAEHRELKEQGVPALLQVVKAAIRDPS